MRSVATLIRFAGEKLPVESIRAGFDFLLIELANLVKKNQEPETTIILVEMI